mmetsp:Transcript_52470/g.83557  ORF Transcript_52470/g.83557 Transcript_52470/m.83557 type:complete len:312 (+) Transcript_52470:1-936(+)
MIARYCYILPKPQLIETLTAFLMSLEDTTLRIELITRSKSVLPPQIISKISANIAKQTIDETMRHSKKQRNAEWKKIERAQAMSNADLHKIDSLKCLKIVNDNMNEIVFRANQLFVIFAKDYKMEAIQKLFDDIHQIIEVNAKRALQMEHHLNTYHSFKLYKLVIDAYMLCKRHPININGNGNYKASNADLFEQYVTNMLLTKYGFLNATYCSVQQLNFDELNEIRAVILQRLLALCYEFVSESKRFAFCLRLVTIFADEKYAYYKLFDTDKSVMKQLLQQAKDAKIEIIKQRQQSLLQQQHYLLQQQQRL